MLRKNYLEQCTSNVEITVISLFGALLSILSTGFVQFESNNIFHLPIVARLYDLPQFQHDSFIQSLRWYSSGLWQTLAGSSSFFNIGYMFAVLLVVSRMITFLAVFHFSSTFGFGRIYFSLILSVIISFSTLLRGDAVGGGYLFCRYFSHSELANGTLLFSVSFALRRQFGLAITLTGLTFFINVFMAIWLIFPISFMLVYALWKHEISFRRAVQQVVFGLSCAGVFAAPVVLNIIRNPDFGKKLSFDYKHFLYGYWPYHFFADTLSKIEYLQLFVVFMSGVVAFRIITKLIQDQDKAMIFAFIGFLAVFTWGVVLPFVSESRLLLNLHLIRSAVTFWLLSSVVVSIVITSWITSNNDTDRKFYGPLAALLFCSFNKLMLLGLLLLLGHSISSVKSYIDKNIAQPLLEKHTWVRFDIAALVILVGVYWPNMVLRNAATAWKRAEAVAEWKAIAMWASSNTPTDAILLIPTFDMRPYILGAERLSDESKKVIEGSIVFEFFSQRRIWVDFKRGAAVMWSPSYYEEWNRRIVEVLLLRSAGEILSYASSHGVSYVIEPCAVGYGSQTVFKTGRLCVYRSQ